MAFGIPVLSLWLFAFGSFTSTTYGLCSFDSCYGSNGEALPCLPDSLSISLKRNVSVTNTCGKTREEYCKMSDSKCGHCDRNNSNEKHPGSFLVDGDKETWWQSQSWWETNQLGLSSSRNPPKVNITLSFGKSYHISGMIQVTFKSERPKAMFIEKSTDDGHTWEPLQYFAQRCVHFYGMDPENSPHTEDPFKVQCTEKYSLVNPRTYGLVKYSSDSRYETCNYLRPNVQAYLLATNVRLRLEYPATDGKELYNDKKHLNKYYYAIANIKISGRCNCNGHARHCDGSLMKRVCSCEHNTMGIDCELCKPLFNNRPWSVANRTDGNACQECECNNKGSSCVYNSTLGNGLCKGCKNNTQGDHCEICVSQFYRNPTKPLNDSAACAACDCFVDGITNNGSCLQNATSTHQIGQCSCKPNVYGRKCDQCKPGHWGFTVPPRGDCQACNCSTNGTQDGSIDCDRVTGKCLCKTTVQGQYCDECKFGHYRFPQGVAEQCYKCPCDLGGAFPGCNKQTGLCHCRQGVLGGHCTDVLPGTFFPAFDYLLLEAEFAMGTFTTVSPANGMGSSFTGRGLAQLTSMQHVQFNNVRVNVSHRYVPIVRYTTSGLILSNTTAELVLTITGVDQSKVLKTQVQPSPLGTPVSHTWQIPRLLNLSSENDYNFTIMFQYSGSSDFRVNIDSLLLIPYINETRVFTLYGAEILRCIKSRTELTRLDSEASNCSKLVFSASTEIYNGTLACDCNAKGSNKLSLCMAYGGQCYCKPGVGGRTCNHCLTGYYNFSSSGCTKCGCSAAGSLTSVCDVHTGTCQCKAEVLGSNCDQCKPSTFNIAVSNPRGCQHCFGYGHATNCTSAPGCAARTISTDFVTNTSDLLQGWKVVDSQDVSVNWTTSRRDGLIVTAPFSPSHVYLSAPAEYLGNKLLSYKQQLQIHMSIRNDGAGEISTASDVILHGRGLNVSLDLKPALSTNTTSYYTILDESHVTQPSNLSSFDFQSMLTNLKSFKVRAVYYPSPSSVLFRNISLGSAVHNQTAQPQISICEKADCHRNYSGLSCQTCAKGYKREVVGGDPFSRCIFCECNGRSTECHPETGVCTDCQVGTRGSRCEDCADNTVLEPNCTTCRSGFWGLSRSGCNGCDCNLHGTLSGPLNSTVNSTVCDLVTGQCSCNATMNVDGRSCDRCKENAWNASVGISDCRECSSCYRFIQTDVHLLRPQVARAQTITGQIAQHPVMQQSNNFASRFNEAVREVLGLFDKASVGARNESEFGTKWRALKHDVESLQSLVDSNLSVAVNSTVMIGSRVHSNHRQINATITLVTSLVRGGYALLNTTAVQRLDVIEAQLVTLVKIAAGLVELTREALKLENATVHVNSTLHAGVGYAVIKADLAAINALTVYNDHHRFSPYLEALLKNVTATKELARGIWNEGLARLRNATSVLNQTRALAERAATANPDNAQMIAAFNAHSSSVNTTSVSLVSQANTHFASSLPVMAQVYSAIDRAQQLVTNVRHIHQNSSSQAASAEVANTIAHNAVSHASGVHRDAAYMLNVLKNFDSLVTAAMVRANASLSSTSVIEQQIHEVMTNSSAVNASIQGPLRTMGRAVELGGAAKQHAEMELQAITRAHTRAKRLAAEAKRAEKLLSNQTTRDYIRREIEPVQKLCDNLTKSAASESAKAQELLRKANETHATRLLVIKKMQNATSEIADLTLTATNHSLPRLTHDIAQVRHNYTSLLASKITQLKKTLQEHKGKYKQQKVRIESLKGDIENRKRLIGSLSAAASSYCRSN